MATIVLVGCLGIPQASTNWNKAGTSDDQMRRDMMNCRQYGMQSAQANGVAGNLFVEAWIQQEANDCMRNLGYGQGVVSSGSSKTGMVAVMEIRNDIQKKQRALCENAELKNYYLKTSCLPLEMTRGQLSDKNKITPTQQLIIPKIRSAEDALNKEERTKLRMSGSTGGAVADFLELSIASQNKNIQDLDGGKVSWGEYNYRRKEIAVDINASISKLPSN